MSEATMCKGGQNPPNTSDKRPPPPDGSGLPELDINIPPPPCKPPKQPDAIERLEAWLVVDESREYEICRVSAQNHEVDLFFSDGTCIEETGPGLSATIHAAIDRAEKLGL